jgi:hypothetical protein
MAALKGSTMDTTIALPHGDAHDFDFLAGHWQVHNRRLVTRLRNANDWIEFEGSSRCEPYLQGAANVDQIDFPTQGFSGLTLRSFDVEQRRWSIFWINSRVGRLEPPVQGGFDGDGGVFLGRDRDDGRDVWVRFDWTRQGRGAARWEQAFSIDGLEWELNWTMQFARVA